MATRDASGAEECPFCQIADNQTDTEILLSVSTDCSFVEEVQQPYKLSSSSSVQDEELLCFRDITPGATHHYLVVPRRHIDYCTRLQEADIPLGDSHVGLIDSSDESEDFS